MQIDLYERRASPIVAGTVVLEALCRSCCAHDVPLFVDLEASHRLAVERLPPCPVCRVGELLLVVSDEA